MTEKCRRHLIITFWVSSKVLISNEQNKHGIGIENNVDFPIAVRPTEGDKNYVHRSAHAMHCGVRFMADIE